MKADDVENERDTFQNLNSGTNIFTLILYIAYSVVKRTEINNLFVIYLLATLCLINSFVSMYLLYRNNNEKAIDFQKRNIWILVRIVANIIFAVLIFYLPK